MLAEQLRILLIEDNPAHARLVREMCLNCDSCDLQITCEHSLSAGLAHLRNEDYDGVLLDLNLPDSLGIDTLNRVNSEFPEIPVIVFTGQGDEATAVQAVSKGAQDYLVKGWVDGNQILRSIRYSIERKRMELDLLKAKQELETRVEERTAELLEINRELEKQIIERNLAVEDHRRSEERFRAVFESASDLIFIKDLSLRYTHVNPATEKLVGIPASELLGKTAEYVFSKEVAQSIREAELRVLSGESIEEICTKELKGVPLTFHEVRVPLYNDSGEIIGVCGIFRDITDLNLVKDTVKLTSSECSSNIMRDVLRQAELAAAGKSVILLLGESGAGKDYLAKYIHERSSYSAGPYFSINCAAVPLELAESELFGHESGAFTGATRRKRGLLELAEGGTLLLNEVGELSLLLQAKLLTFLDTRTFTRVGGQQKISVNARIIAATNRDLQKEISNGRFRPDLYYRLNVMSLRVPPLRERFEDLPILVAESLASLTRELQIGPLPELSAQEMNKLYSYHWPGNIRELRNVLERGLILSAGKAMKLDLTGLQQPNDLQSPSGFVDLSENSTLADSMKDLSRAMIEEALTRSKGKKELAASYLGVSRYTLRRWIQKLGINVRN